MASFDTNAFELPERPAGTGAAGFAEMAVALRFFLAVLALTAIESAVWGVLAALTLSTVTGSSTPVLFYSPPVPGINYAGFYYPGTTWRSSFGFFLLVAPGLLDILALLLLVVGWVRWRDGLRFRVGEALARGSKLVSHHLRRARVAYLEASLCYALLLVVNVVLGGVWLYYATLPLAAVARQHHVPVWSYPLVGLPLVVLTIAVYFFTGESFRQAAWASVSAGPRRQLQSGVVLLFFAGLLSSLVLAEAVSVDFAYLAWISPVVAIGGTLAVYRVYSGLARRTVTAPRPSAVSFEARAPAADGPTRPAPAPESP